MKSRFLPDTNLILATVPVISPVSGPQEAGRNRNRKSLIKMGHRCARFSKVCGPKGDLKGEAKKDGSGKLLISSLCVKKEGREMGIFIGSRILPFS